MQFDTPIKEYLHCSTQIQARGYKREEDGGGLDSFNSRKGYPRAKKGAQIFGSERHLIRNSIRNIRKLQCNQYKSKWIFWVILGTTMGVVTGTGCAMGVLFQAESTFQGIIFGKIAIGHIFWGTRSF